jgi:hypothetical protein
MACEAKLHNVREGGQTARERNEEEAVRPVCGAFCWIFPGLVSRQCYVRLIHPLPPALAVQKKKKNAGVRNWTRTNLRFVTGKGISAGGS